MRRIDVMKKRPSRWPWALGVIVLALALWGATVLLRPPAEDEGPELPVTTADTLPPTQIPLTRGGARAAPEPPSLSELMPLNEEQVGETVKVEGDVVATGTDAIWILVGSHVVRVESRRARKGEAVSVEGVIRAATTDTADRLAEQVLAREPGSEAWTMISDFKIVEGAEDGADEDAEVDAEDEADAESGEEDGETTGADPEDDD